jgi:hypothetical protein
MLIKFIKSILSTGKPLGMEEFIAKQQPTSVADIEFWAREYDYMRKHHNQCGVWK